MFFQLVYVKFSLFKFSTIWQFFLAIKRTTFQVVHAAWWEIRAWAISCTRRRERVNKIRMVTMQKKIAQIYLLFYFSIMHIVRQYKTPIKNIYIIIIQSYSCYYQSPLLNINYHINFSIQKFVLVLVSYSHTTTYQFHLLISKNISLFAS